MSGLRAVLERLRDAPPQTQSEFDDLLEWMKPRISLAQMARFFGIVDDAPVGVRKDLDAIDATTLEEIDLQFNGAAGFAAAMRTKRELGELEEQLLVKLIGYEPRQYANP